MVFNLIWTSFQQTTQRSEHQDQKPPATGRSSLVWHENLQLGRTENCRFLLPWMTEYVAGRICWFVRQETAELLQMARYRCVSEFCCFVSVEIWTFLNTARASQTKSRNPNNWTSRLRHGKPAAGIEALRTTTAWLGMTGYVDVAGRIWWFARQETGHKQLLVLSVNSVHWVTL